MPTPLTVPALIDLVLESCAAFERYQGPAGKRAFLRDQNQLIKAIARFGYVCHQRGWEFSADEIVDPILKVVSSLRGREDEIKMWFPRYLECAIDRHVRLKAENYNALAKSKRAVPRLVAKAIEGTTAVVAIREPSHTELLAAAYGDKRKTIKVNARSGRQKSLDILAREKAKQDNAQPSLF